MNVKNILRPTLPLAAIAAAVGTLSLVKMAAAAEPVVSKPTPKSTQRALGPEDPVQLVFATQDPRAADIFRRFVEQGAGTGTQLNGYFVFSRPSADGSEICLKPYGKLPLTRVNEVLIHDQGYRLTAGWQVASETWLVNRDWVAWDKNVWTGASFAKLQSELQALSDATGAKYHLRLLTKGEVMRLTEEAAEGG